MKLSAHFSLEEMTASQTASRHNIANLPGADAVANLYRLAKYLENVRSAIGKPITVTSGYRCPLLNRMVGSGATSQHVIGCAVDFKVAGMTTDEIIEVIVTAGLPYDQLIREFNSWVHYSIPNALDMPWRMQALIIDSMGTRLYPIERQLPIEAEKKTLFSRLFG